MAGKRIWIDTGKDCLLHEKMPSTMTQTERNGRIIRELWDTLQAVGKHCVGLAAPQIGERESICIIRHGSLVLINPVITNRWGKHPSVEACYSLPGYEAIIPRARKITVLYQNNVGDHKSITTENLSLSVVLQHEIDHLNGVLISDYVNGKHGKKGGIIINAHNTRNPTNTNFLNQLQEFGPIEGDKQ